MSWCRCLLASALALACTLPAPAAQLFGKKTTKVNPQQRVPELILAVQSDPEERKRSAAAEELRHFSGQEFPEIVPILAEAMKREAAVGVRVEIATSLARIQPASKAAHDALERAASQDAHWRVRLNSRSSLVFYHVPAEAGPRKVEPAPTQAPVVVERRMPFSATPVSNAPRLQPTPVQTGPPPLAAPNQTEPPPLILGPPPTAPQQEPPLLIPPQ